MSRPHAAKLRQVAGWRGNMARKKLPVASAVRGNSYLASISAALRRLGSSKAAARPSLIFALLLLLTAPLCLGLFLRLSRAATPNIITVNTTDDPASTSNSGSCTLREAIDNANSPGTDTTNGDCAVATGNDTILFSVSGTILLNGELPQIANTSPASLTIDGGGHAIVDGHGSYGILSVTAGATLYLSNLTIEGGVSPASNGAGVFNSGTLVVTNSTFFDNSARHDTSGSGSGGAIYNLGTLTVTGSTFSTNGADPAPAAGGAIYNDVNALTISNSTFVSNTAGSGGAIFSVGPLTVTNSNFNSNGAEGGNGGAIDCVSAAISDSTFAYDSANSGGGIDCQNSLVSNSTFDYDLATFGAAMAVSDGTATISDSTFSTNGAIATDIGGGAIYAENSNVSVNSSTISANGPGGGIYADAGEITIRDSILAGNEIAAATLGGNCVEVNGGSVIDGGYNLSDDNTCALGRARRQWPNAWR